MADYISYFLTRYFIITVSILAISQYMRNSNASVVDRYRDHIFDLLQEYKSLYAEKNMSLKDNTEYNNVQKTTQSLYGNNSRYTKHLMYPIYYMSIPLLVFSVCAFVEDMWKPINLPDYIATIAGMYIIIGMILNLYVLFKMIDNRNLKKDIIDEYNNALRVYNALIIA